MERATPSVDGGSPGTHVLARRPPDMLEDHMHGRDGREHLQLHKLHTSDARTSALAHLRKPRQSYHYASSEFNRLTL